MSFMNEFCDTPFWDLNVTWYTENPDFTDCFKNTALQWFPCLVLWILLPMELYNLKTSQMRDIPYNKYNVIKLTAIVCIIGTTIAELGDNVMKNATILANIYSPVIKMFTYMLFLLLTWGNIKMGIRTSGISFVFSFLSVICGIPLARDTLRHSDSLFVDIYDRIAQKRCIFVVYYLSTIVILVLNIFVDRRPRYSLCAMNDKLCLSKNSSFLSDLYLCWFTRYVWKNYSKPLNDILWYVDHEDSAAGILPRFEKYWNKALTKQKAEKMHEVDGDCISLSQKPFVFPKQIKCSIFCPLLKLIWFEILQAFLWRTSDLIMNLSPPLIFSLLITFITEKEPIWKAYACVFLFFLSPFFQVITLRKYFEVVLKIQIRIRAAILSVVYKKALKISNEARKQYSGGDILNLISIDTARICEFMKFMNHIWAAPAQIIISLYFLWGILGTSTISSVIVFGCILVANHYVVKYSKVLRIKEMVSKDTRCKFLQEILSGIKVLKMYAWESSFEKIALDMRRKEMGYLKKLACLQVISSLFFTSTPFLLPLVTFATYILSDVNNVLDVNKAFICISFFNTFRTPVNQMLYVLNSLMQTYVAVKRINKFLNLEELDCKAVTHENREEALVIENGTFSWENNDNSTILRNINLKIKEGSLVAIVGSVGAGKSSLISAFLGEMYKLSGYVNVKGTTAYVPQQAWIMNTSLKENITLGDVIDDALYNKAIDACALKTDLQSLSDGDLTEIGEKGVNLSGGQKQRVSLARAICSDKDIYFFDDPLSAVDFNVAEHIFRNVLGPEGVLRTKTRVLVTHSTAFLHKMDLIIVLKKGSISESGTFNEIMRNDKEFAEFLRSYCKDVDEKIHDNDDTEINTLRINEEVIELESMDLGYEKAIEEEIEKEKIQQMESDSYSPKKLIDKERMESGNIKLKVYSYYVKTAGPFFVFSTIILYLLFQCLSVVSNSWLAKWTQIESSTSKDKHRLFYLSIYVIIGLCQEICIVLANSSMFKFLLRASLVLYNRLLTNILRWPMSLFDSTPVGRIINRFTVDVDSLDNNLCNKLVMLLLFASKFLAVSAVIVSNTPSCALFILPTITFMYIIQKFYMVLSHQLKRVESVYRSPLYSFFMETASGLESIRAFNIQEKFTRKILDKNDLCSATAYSIFVCGRWLTIYLEILVGIIISLTSFFVISERDRFDKGTLAFIITYTIQISREVNYLVVNLAEVENTIVSVERIKEFIDKPCEPNQSASYPILSSNWPSRGQITFQNYKLRYRDELDLVLKNVTFTINSGEKVGIIGRTGAGKTSIILALFRIVEPADGKIFIDGVDISTISLHLLRSKLTVIPQDPVLFVGTLRFNLDPFDSYTDEVLWDVLNKAHLKDFVRELPNSLHYKIEEGGGNLSFGQKQLICLARALLRKTKILVLDEATASVDLETDELIQRTIRKEFSDCTVLTIAHRLNTVQDYDKILLMDNGIVVEFDAPTNLLKNKTSIFYKLATDSGLLIHEKKDNTGSV